MEQNLVLAGFILTYLGIGLVIGMVMLIGLRKIHKTKKAQREMRDNLFKEYPSSMVDEIMDQMQDIPRVVIVSIVMWPLVVKNILDAKKRDSGN